MGWVSEMKVLLIVLVFSKWPLTTHTLLQESSLAGMPLSEAEYKDFFRILTTRRVIHAVCFRRAIFGCYDPIIQALDRYENHGVIPNGWICTDFPDNTSFPGFCDFALYRCSTRKYFGKRVLCPDEMTEKPAVIQTNQEGTPEDTLISTTERPFELTDSTSATSTESWPKPLATTETAAAEISDTPLPNTETAAVEILSSLLPATETAAVETLVSPLPTTETAAIEILSSPLSTTETATIEISATPFPSTTAKTPLLDLLSSSAVEMAAKLISKILDAFTATKKSSPESTTSESLVELTPTSAAIDTPESFSELPTTTTPTDEFSVDLTDAAAIITETELNLATMAAIAAPTEATTPDFSSELATAMEIFPESTSDNTESFFDSAIDTTTTTSDIEPCVVDYPEPLDTSPDSTSSTSSTSILSIHTATMPTEAAAAATSSTTAASLWPFVPSIDAVLPFPPPPPNKTMHIVILSVISDKNVKNEDMAGKSALQQTALGSGNVLQQEGVQNPPRMNALKDLFLRLHDNGVQQLMHTMQDGISGEQKSRSLQFLNALKSRSHFEKRLQR